MNDMTARGAIAKNMRLVTRMDLTGGGQVTCDGTHVFVGHMKPPHGTTIIDVADPKNPKVIAALSLPDNRSHTHKVRVAGDIMIVNLEQNERHLMRRAGRIPETEAKLKAKLGRAPSDDEISVEIKIKAGEIPRLREAIKHEYDQGGFRVYSIADRAKPRLLAQVKTHGFGTHRFDMDHDYAYISTEMEGYVGNILVNYSLKNPEKPEEVSRWWMPGQHVAGGEKPTWEGYKNRLHHALRQGNHMWASVWNAGLRIIDVSDIRKPRTVGSYNYHPPFPEPTHTVLKVPFKVKGRDIAVVIDEEHDHTPGQLHAGLWVFDVSDFANIQPLSMFHLSELDSPYATAGVGRFGAHQFQEHMRDTRVYATWFSGGLRVIDVADPMAPTEIAHYIPEPFPGHKSPQSNDVDVDARGLVYLLDRDRGLEILEMTA